MVASGSKASVSEEPGDSQLVCNCPLSVWTSILANSGHFCEHGASRFAKTVSTEHQ